MSVETCSPKLHGNLGLAETRIQTHKFVQLCSHLIDGINMRQFCDQLLSSHHQLSSSFDEVFADIKVAFLFLVQPIFVLSECIELVAQVDIYKK